MAQSFACVSSLSISLRVNHLHHSQPAAPRLCSHLWESLGSGPAPPPHAHGQKICLCSSPGWVQAFLASYLAAAKGLRGRGSWGSMEAVGGWLAGPGPKPGCVHGGTHPLWLIPPGKFLPAPSCLLQDANLALPRSHVPLYDASLALPGPHVPRCQAWPSPAHVCPQGLL